MELSQLFKLSVGDNLVYDKDGKFAEFEIVDLDPTDDERPVKVKLLNANVPVLDSLYEDLDNNFKVGFSFWIYTNKAVAMEECNVSRRQADQIIGDKILAVVCFLKPAGSSATATIVTTVINSTDGEVADINAVRERTKIVAGNIDQKISEINRKIWEAADSGKNTVDVLGVSKVVLEIFEKSGYTVNDNVLSW